MTARQISIAAIALGGAIIAGLVVGGCSGANARTSPQAAPHSAGPADQISAGTIPSTVTQSPSSSPSSESAAPTGSSSPAPTRSAGRTGGMTHRPAVAPGRLTVDRIALHLGTAGGGSLTLRNVGGSPLTWRATPSATFLTPTRVSGSLRPGASQLVTIALNSPPDGHLSRQVTFTAAGASRRVSVTADVNIPPVIHSLYSVRGGLCASMSSEFQAEVQDAQGVAGVQLRYGFYPDAGSPVSGTPNMTRAGTSLVWYASAGPFSGPGLLYYAATAWDATGLVTNTTERTIRVEAC